MRLDDSAQCSHNGFARDYLARVPLCWRHERAAEHGTELSLTSDRRLFVEREWSTDGWRRDIKGVRIIENLVDLEHRWRDQAPPGWEPVSDEQRRAAAEALGVLFSRVRPPFNHDE
jgi:hypothetical protein